MVGGLAAALLPAVKKSGVIWFGSSGKLRNVSAAATPLFEVESYGRGTIARVDLPEQYYEGFYSGYANSALWPILHSRADISRSDAEHYAAYREVNSYMARTLATFGSSRATFWIHDYHFLPLAHEMRKLGIRRKIGFFLHTPWPDRRVITQLTEYRELAQAMLAYDLIGFQSDRDRDNFAALLRHELHVPGYGLTFNGRHGACRLGTFPIGIDAEDFAAHAEAGSGDPEVRRLCDSLTESRLVIGVDRVDYSKGLSLRIRAFDRLLTRYPGLKRRLSLLQIAVPSRSCIETYRELQCDLARLVGEVNGRHGEVDWTPIRYLNKGFCQSTLAGFYRAAIVGLITPLRDGMNLVAKEYVAAQNPDDPGVLVLSKFAGAANELDAALLVDPQDLDGIGQRIATALVMPLEERRARWQRMMQTLLRHSIHTWFTDFMRTLKAPEPENVFPLLPAKVPLRAAANRTWAAHPH
jgi:trehalose 6-phosphate synthase